MSKDQDEMRMDAYYYGFCPTGVHEIDVILSAVACAGKAYHSTDGWVDSPCEPYEPKHHRGESCVEWIQNAANDAADASEKAIPLERVRAVLLQLRDGLRVIPDADMVQAAATELGIDLGGADD